MGTRFRTISTSSQLAEEIRRRISTGELAGQLPGIRRLMAEFATTRTEVEGALAELAHSGHVAARGRRRPPEIIRRDRPADGEGTLVLHADPMERRTGDHREILLAMEAVLPAPVIRLSLPSDEAQKEKIVARVLESPCRKVVTMDHSAEVTDLLVRAGRIVVAAGTAGESKLASQVSVSHEMLVRGALNRAFAAGHRRISFPLWRRHPEVATRMRAWIADEYARHGLRHSPQFDAPMVPGRDPQSLHQTLRELLRHTPPTAFIASDFRQWLATLSLLGETGLRIPREVSLICLCATPDWDVVSPSPAHFRFPVTEMVTAVAKALDAAERGAPRRETLLTPEWVPGRSLGPPPNAARG